MQKGSLKLTIGAILGKNSIKYDWGAVKALSATVASFLVALAAYSDHLPDWIDKAASQGVIVAGIIGTLAGLLATAQSLPPLVVPAEPEPPTDE